jgi:hypothetical protein
VEVQLLEQVCELEVLEVAAGAEVRKVLNLSDGQGQAGRCS